MTRHRRSLWASPAVVGFEPPVMASKPDCDSTGDELQQPGRVTDSSEAGDQAGDQRRPSSVLATPASTERSVAQRSFSSAKAESEEGKRRSGRRLFPDVVSSDDMNLSADFKPLWSGSATVTKDRPSVSPSHGSGSANTSKKLFPDISLEGASAAASGRLSTSQLLEEKEVQPAQPVVDPTAVSGTNQPAAAGTTRAAKPHRHRLSAASLRNNQKGRGAAEVELRQSFEFSSTTPQLARSPGGDEPSRRATLTVTKSRPSLALLLHANDGVARAVAKETDDEAAPEVVAKRVEEEEVRRTDTIVVETRVNVSVVPEHLTPSELPTSPRSENSRRSTHAVRNPIILNKDGVVPRNLFAAVPEQQHVPRDEGIGDGMRQAGTESIKDTLGATTTTTRWTEDGEEENLPSKSRKDSSVTKGDESLRFMDVFTERVERHLHCQREKIVRPTRFSSSEVTLDSSVGSQELSTDSLEAERRSSSSRQTPDVSADGRDFVDPAARRIGGDSRGSVAVEQASERMSGAAQKGSEVPAAKTSGAGRGTKEISPPSARSLTLTAESESSLTESARSRSRFAELTSEIQSQDEEDASLSVPQSSHHTECSFPEVTPIPSLTSVESKVSAVQASDQVSSSGPRDDDPRRAKLTQAEPILTHAVVKEVLLREGSAPQTDVGVASTSDVAVSGIKDRPAGHGQLRRSVSSEHRSKVSRASHAGKRPVASSVGEAKTSAQITKSWSATSLAAQALPRARSQNSLVSEKRTEQPNRKRTSPQAGLKEPRSKRGR